MKTLRSYILKSTFLIFFLFILSAFPDSPQIQVQKYPGQSTEIDWNYDVNLEPNLTGFAVISGGSPNGPWSLYATVPNPSARSFTFGAPSRTTYYGLVAYRSSPLTMFGNYSGISSIVTVTCIPLKVWIWTVRGCQ